MSKISIVGVPMDLGADRRGVDMGPSALRYADLNEKLQALGYEVDDLGDLDVIIPETRHFGDPHAKYLKEIADACTHLANLVLEIHTDHRTPIVLGGDHSIAVGTMSGMAESFRRQNAKIGLMWFDAHADFNTPQISPSGNVHGMPMAAIMGYGPIELTRIFGFSPKIQPERAVMIGIREVDPQERELVKSSGVRVFTMKEIDRRGIGSVMDEALSIVTKDTDGFSVTLDADFLDPYESPGVATPVRGGADYREAHLAMEMVADTKKMVSFEIAEINPILDVQNKTAHFGMELILSAFGKQIL
ncbi:MAG: arginase [Acidobacteria bacterium 13_1_40CM_3_56_11]|nr:MAG: arginase [Acidobacteria bacterium 13_1_40CM_3_56_11]